MSNEEPLAFKIVKLPYQLLIWTLRQSTIFCTFPLFLCASLALKFSTYKLFNNFGASYATLWPLRFLLINSIFVLYLVCAALPSLLVFKMSAPEGLLIQNIATFLSFPITIFAIWRGYLFHSRLQPFKAVMSNLNLELIEM